MKKRYILLFLILFIPFFVFAEEKKGYTDGNVKLRSTPSTNSSLVPCADGSGAVVSGEVTIYEQVTSTDAGDNCASHIYYKIKGYDIGDHKAYTGYGCSDFVVVSENTSNDNSLNGDKVISYGTINNSYVYTTPNTNGSRRVSKQVTERVPILGSTPNLNIADSCKTMIKVLYDNIISYVCIDNFKNVVDVSVLDTNNVYYDYNHEASKFPSNYRSYLDALHKQHPTWRFYAVNTNLDFYTAVDNEKNASYLDSYDNDQSFYDTLERANYDWSSNTFIYHEASRWVTASREAAAYYLDPRNYLDEKNVFVFEDSKAYTYQVEAAIKQMTIYGGINSSFEADGKTYTYMQAFKDGAAFSKVSPLTLIARSRIETGKFTSNSVSGTYAPYQGYYNYYNIGAFGTNPVTNGLIYAKNAGWNNRYKSIVEGASFIATKYIYSGQETQYFQKFNVNPSSLNSIYGHQYQTNIQAPTVEGTYVYWGYKDSGNIDKPIVFLVPVYKNMPEKAAVKPKAGNPNNWLKSITLNGAVLTNNGSNFDGNIYYSYDNDWDGKADATYSNNVIKYTINYDVNEVDIKAVPIVSGTTISGAGKIKITNPKTTIDVVSKAANGTTKTYRIIVTRKDAPTVDEHGNVIYANIDDVLNKVSVKYNSNYIKGLQLGTNYNALINAISNVNSTVKTTVSRNTNNKTGNFATGDKVVITNGKDTRTLTYVLYGDLNGDGNINLADMVHVRNIILNESNLAGAYREAGDINHDGNINLADLVYVRNHILGSYITQ